MDRNLVDGRSRYTHYLRSLPARGAWIEISRLGKWPRGTIVAPREGSVDRNHDHQRFCENQPVAPREGSVDRNISVSLFLKICNRSLPARGAWIEILKLIFTLMKKTSLPARGAWIEILKLIFTLMKKTVAPREGSVDRNNSHCFFHRLHNCRSPRGERG